jgi:3-hydroxyacyl-CoA dehydrogenase/enoyl-CoA hydratase/3-hydroxybutyryl-CoA epimerase/3-hydroxyacyl-CoA dehydrogenase/enoyl-CoA hydratase/3-hydroxybutyryl-CoA epimerase/enoyl-CoA isomerase
MDSPSSLSGGGTRKAGVVGAGQMGAGIAGTLVKAGILTTLVDVSPAMLAAAVDRVSRIAGTEASHPLLATSAELSALADSDLIIEAVTEQESTKSALFRTLSGLVRPDAILATNTSTIPISRLAQAADHPERFAGMHFFHPVHRMELVEVIRGERTSPETVSRLVELAQRLGKTPIVVRDGPGFFTTRVLFPYLSQALRMVQEGTPMDAIDEAAFRFGMPIGPIALLDLIGLDTALAISKVMAGAFPDRAAVSPVLAEMVQRGRLGRKTRAGFRHYDHPGSQAISDPAVEPIVSRHRLAHESSEPESITDRLFLAMLLEAVRTLEEGIVADPADVDRGVLLGFGFPAARGGIVAWGRHEGEQAIARRLAHYQHLGPAFRPPAGLHAICAVSSAPHAG